MGKVTAECKDVLEHICENLDANLYSPECAAIKEHIAECPGCNEYLEGLKATISLYKNYEIPKPKTTLSGLVEKLISNVK